MKIYRWRGQSSVHGNFGDEITGPILRTIFGIEAVPSPMRAAELLAAGSILDSWRRATFRTRIANALTMDRSRDLHVWGTGSMLPGEPIWPQRLHVHAVRGALTSGEVGADVVLGDPGILAGLLVEGPSHKDQAVGLVPHYVDFDFVRRSIVLPPRWKLISPEQSVKDVLSQIAASDLIASSSLHGLIAADSFGIPCLWLSTLNPLHGASDFKFRDHATARGAKFNEPLSYERLVAMTPDEMFAHSTTAARPIGRWQEELIAAFPFR